MGSTHEDSFADYRRPVSKGIDLRGYIEDQHPTLVLNDKGQEFLTELSLFPISSEQVATLAVACLLTFGRAS